MALPVELKKNHIYFILCYPHGIHGFPKKIGIAAALANISIYKYMRALLYTGLYKKDETVKTTWNSLNSTVKNSN